MRELAHRDLTWIDSHCHLQMLGVPVGDALARSRAAGVEAVVCVGTDLASSLRAVEVAAQEPDVWAAVGLHPHGAAGRADEWPGLVELSTADRVVAVGETGLDYFYEHSARDAQIASFRLHIQLAHQRDLGLVVHSRDAWDDTFRVLEEETIPPRTILHCFTGGPAEAERALALGAHLSFSGIVSFKNADDVRAAAAVTPADRMLVETDAPFLAPVPHRGGPNEPAFVVDVGLALAGATGRDLEAVADATRSLTRTLLRL
ncbi:MAG: TatD family hydrolase [Acidimicrobiia bacterium]